MDERVDFTAGVWRKSVYCKFLLVTENGKTNITKRDPDHVPPSLLISSLELNSKVELNFLRDFEVWPKQYSILYRCNSATSFNIPEQNMIDHLRTYYQKLAH